MAYTTINKPSDYFNTNLRSGTGGSTSVSNMSFAPDLVWIKSRSDPEWHQIFDKTRGALNRLASNESNAEYTLVNSLTSFNSDGYSLGSDGGTNGSGKTFVDWTWLAGSTASSNTDGSITSTVSANTTSGFSIVSYTGTGSAGTVGHGLNNAPEMIILKRRDGGVGNTNWFVGHKDLTSWGYRLFLNSNLAEGADSDFLANTAPTSNHFSVSTDVSTNGSSGSQLAYCFHSVKGFSKIGSYTGNNSSDGNFIYTGFQPAWVMIKDRSSGQYWHIADNQRDAFNPSIGDLVANESWSESTTTSNRGNTPIDFVSNGFKIRTDSSGINGTGNHIYMAFAESPFTTSTGVPTTAR